MSLFGNAAAQQAPTPAASGGGDLSKDVAVNTSGLTDSISAIEFSPTHDYLAVASWDKKVRMYEIDGTGQSKPLVDYEHAGPVLDCTWSQDGRYCASASADKSVKIFDTQNPGNPAQQVAAHDEPIRCVKMFSTNGNNMLVTGSWDKKIRYWDLRQQTPAAEVTVSERVYTMDISQQLMVVGTADRWIEIFNLGQNPTQVYKKIQSPLKWQTRVVSCFTDATGFAVGSIEGRCAIQYVEDKDNASNFSFKCHRATTPGNKDETQVHSVNAISFHPQHGTFSTSGSDGTYHFWDKDAKHRLKGYPAVGGSITSTSFNRNGNIFGYAISYDWSQGYAKNSPQYPTKVMLHPIAAEECKPRPGGRKR